MEALALYSYTAASNGELSFDEKSTVKILNEKDPDWYLAEQCGQEGYAPTTYIQFLKPLWYRNVTKVEATKMLGEKNGKTDRHSKGVFLVRPSESGDVDLSIAVKLNAIEHFKIVRDKGEYFIWRAAPHFSSVDQLIDYYRNKPIGKSENTLLNDMKLKSVVAQYDYKAQTPEEIDICAGETIALFDDSDRDWWKGQVDRDGVTYRGFFPATYASRCK